MVNTIKKFLIVLFDMLLLLLVIILACFAARFAWLKYYKSAYPLGYERIVYEQCEKNGVSPALIFAVIRTESGFNPNAESSIPARGLMQITPDTFEWIRYRLGEDGKFDYDDMFDSETNIRYGTALMRLLIREFGSDTNALCAYHAGWGNVTKWLQNPEYSQDGEIMSIPFGDTRRHVSKALAAKDIYVELYGLPAENTNQLTMNR